MLQVMQRDHKLRSYTLNSVCAHFLGEIYIIFHLIHLINLYLVHVNKIFEIIKGNKKRKYIILLSLIYKMEMMNHDEG